MTMITLTPPLSRTSRAAQVTAALTDTYDVAVRNLRTLLRTPQALVFATIQPVIFVLLFRYAFGGAIHVPGVNYVDFLMPGICASARSAPRSGCPPTCARGS
jgi:ABC-2 type transport system permease protein